MNKLKVGIIGATGMVGQRFAALLSGHPWFETTVLAASARSAGKPYEEAVREKCSTSPHIPEELRRMKLYDAADVRGIADRVDFVFCAIDLDKAAIRDLEDAYALAERPVISNNSAHRDTPDVPMIIPELNASHMAVIDAQRKRLGTKCGFIAVKSNCSIQSYVPMLHPLRERYGLKSAVVSTYQAVSGAGKTIESFPEIRDNVIPYIKGEEKKSELEPLKIWGTIEDGKIIPAATPVISAKCVRIPVSDGHLASVLASFESKPDLEDIKSIWRGFSGLPQELKLPSAPKQFIHYFEEPDRPQTRLDRDLENGMAVAAGRLQSDRQFDIGFVGLSHNTVRGAAGGAVLLAELLYACGYIES
jgi:aspartate-semialdehyde dehydrogenase